MIFTQKMVHVDSNVYFKIVTQNGQVSSVNQFRFFLKSLLLFSCQEWISEILDHFSKNELLPQNLRNGTSFRK